MKEFKLYGLKFFVDGTTEKTLIRRRKATEDYEESIMFCADLPNDEYDGFLFIDENTGRQFPRNLGKPLRERKELS